MTGLSVIADTTAPGSGRQEQDILLRLQARGVGVWLDRMHDQTDGLVIQYIDVKAADADLELMSSLDRLRELWLVGPRITVAGMRAVGHLSGLRRLCLVGPAVTDAGLKELQGLHGLAHLTVSSPHVTQLDALFGLRGLRRVELRACSVTGEAVARFRGGAVGECAVTCDLC